MSRSFIDGSQSHAWAPSPFQQDLQQQAYVTKLAAALIADPDAHTSQDAAFAANRNPAAYVAAYEAVLAQHPRAQPNGDLACAALDKATNAWTECKKSRYISPAATVEAWHLVERALAVVMRSSAEPGAKAYCKAVTEYAKREHEPEMLITRR